MSEPTPTELYRRWTEGDQDAASLLFSLYSRKLTGLAEQHLSHRLAPRLDGEDIVQSVFRTFFKRGERGDFHIDDEASIWRLLVKITINKARTQARRHTAPRRDVRAESGGQDPWLLESLATEPGPVEASVLVDQIDEALRGLPDSYAQVLALHLEGHRRGEIAAQLGLSRQTVYRALATLKQRLQQLANDAGPD